MNTPKCTEEMPSGLASINAHGRRARIRAIEQPRDLRVEKSGCVTVSSLSSPSTRRKVTFYGGPGEIVWFSCNCPSGRYREHLPVPCVHAAQTGLLLEATGLAEWRGGLIYRTESK